MAQESGGQQNHGQSPSVLDGPAIDPAFSAALDKLVGVARQGHKPASKYFNPPDQWLIDQMPVIQDMPQQDQERLLEEARVLSQENESANAEGRAGTRVWPDAVVRLDNGGLAFFSQLGVVRRPDLTQYFIDGFQKNRDALPFSEANQTLFTDVFSAIAEYLTKHFASGQAVVQTDRQIGDAPGRSFHARQLLFGENISRRH